MLVGALGQDSVLLNDGTGTFTDATGAEMPADDRRSFGVALADTDEDLDLDLLVATPQGQNRYYDNGIAAPRVQISVTPSYIEVTDTVTINVNAFDEDGVSSTFHGRDHPAGRVDGCADESRRRGISVRAEPDRRAHGERHVDRAAANSTTRGGHVPRSGERYHLLRSRSASTRPRSRRVRPRSFRSPQPTIAVSSAGR
ncbi:MAG: FG-GAP-like repeat-containing protein [Pseudomonadales bacterium]